MDRTLYHLLVIFIVGLALGVGQYRDRLLGEDLEKNKVVHAPVSTLAGVGLKVRGMKRYARGH